MSSTTIIHTDPVLADCAVEAKLTEDLARQHRAQMGIRDKAIRRARKAGWSAQEVANATGLTQPRVTQISPLACAH